MCASVSRALCSTPASQKLDRMLKWRGPGCRISTEGRSSQRPRCWMATSMAIGRCITARLVISRKNPRATTQAIATGWEPSRQVSHQRLACGCHGASVL